MRSRFADTKWSSPDERSEQLHDLVHVLARVNAEIDAGRLRNRGGETVKERISEGLVREDGRILYPVDDGIPVMLIDESIELS